ncbi:SpoIIE family protein phosphatase [Streptomyces scopuliridis]|uniref:SpoIIE family protein phosphatase n=1 Tax=Streptomyces scopuliridis TaxID=452529 RepID=A0ACD4ZPA4_9ACTN|nr:SpoIIE family protein phosphatase [Streptomyces scopuliridis]WSC00224.1 SpoIIE family protein phosphatase [Streptomyces scopuliridis]WSC06166.1 SpoIIE family protein phosphatase [Streptomyces scopuliridis]
MGRIPIPRETLHLPASQVPLRRDTRSTSRTSLPGNPLAPSAARRFTRAALADWTSLGLLTTCTFCQGDEGCSPGEHSTDLLADDAVLIVDELVTNAVVHAGTTVELLCRLEDPGEDASGTPEGEGEEPAAVVLEVSDHHPARAIQSDATGQAPAGTPEYGRGLQLVAALAERWGITYRSGLKTVWARLPLEGRDPGQDQGAEPALRRGLRAAEILAPATRRTVRDDPEWTGRGALSFLAEASELLAGQLDEDLVAALAGQLLVPRLAEWCAVWLDAEGGQQGAAPRLARVWHADEARIEPLRRILEKEPPRLPVSPRGGPVRMPWPGAGSAAGADSGSGSGPDSGAALACRLVANGRALGTLLLGRPGRGPVPDEVTALIEDFARRVALAIGAARRYTRQVTISRVLQRGLLPSQVARIPGIASSLVYEPSDDGLAGGDFYDVFPCPPGDRWCFMLGDVQGSGPEAAVVTGLARPWLRLLAREGYRVGAVLDRLNRLLLDDATETAESASLMVAASAAPGVPSLPATPPSPSEGSQARFLSLLYGELMPLPGAGGAVRCTLASAGHPLPLLLRPDGTVRPAAEPQLLLGVVEQVAYESSTFDLEPGDTLLCVTDGVTERRSGRRMLDDGDGLARALAGCVGLTAQGVAERIRQVVHDFDESPPEDDVALLVLQAT